MSTQTLHLQAEETNAISKALIAVLTDGKAVNLLYPSGAEVRAATRALRKLQWAQQPEKENTE